MLLATAALSWALVINEPGHIDRRIYFDTEAECQEARQAFNNQFTAYIQYRKHNADCFFIPVTQNPNQGGHL